MPTDLTQNEIQVGDIVNVPCVITAIGGTAGEPTLTLTTKYPGFNDATDSIGPLDTIQVILDR